jgi:hypothetical protein
MGIAKFLLDGAVGLFREYRWERRYNRAIEANLELQRQNQDLRAAAKESTSASATNHKHVAPVKQK